MRYGGHLLIGGYLLSSDQLSVVRQLAHFAGCTDRVDYCASSS